jgi:hypothetical protein
MIDVVVAYDRSAARLLEHTVYVDDATAAFDMRLERELAYRRRTHVEVVLLRAAHFDDLKVSHARYFDPQSIAASNLNPVIQRVLSRRAS